MKRIFRNWFVRWVVLPMVLIYGWFVYNYPTCTFRYKLTAEVMTPDGLKTGSSVIEVSYGSVHPLPNPGRWSADTVSGEAVYVDLGGGKNLFVLLGKDYWERPSFDAPGRHAAFDGIDGGEDTLTEQKLASGSLSALWLPVQVFKLGRTVGDERAMQRRADALLGQAPVEVPLINVPMLGTFANIAVPQTFNTLLPTDIGKVLGAGYLLQSVKMQMVDEDVPKQIKAVLPWLKNEAGQGIVACRAIAVTEVKGACRVTTSDFKHSNSP